MAGFGDLLNAISGRLPDSRITSTISIPSQADIDQIEKQLAALPVDGGLSTMSTRAALTLKLQNLRKAQAGLTHNGITPAPEKPGVFSNQVETPLIGLDALTIPI